MVVALLLSLVRVLKGFYTFQVVLLDLWTMAFEVAVLCRSVR